MSSLVTADETGWITRPMTDATPSYEIVLIRQAALPGIPQTHARRAHGGIDSDWGFPIVQVKVEMVNQDGKIVVTSLNEVELPR